MSDFTFFLAIFWVISPKNFLNLWFFNLFACNEDAYSYLFLMYELYACSIEAIVCDYRNQCFCKKAIYVLCSLFYRWLAEMEANIILLKALFLHFLLCYTNVPFLSCKKINILGRRWINVIRRNWYLHCKCVWILFFLNGILINLRILCNFI